jgi:hypothetical protein
MKKSPQTKLREKNKDLKTIANLLGCKPIASEILASVIEAQSWREKMTEALMENDSLRVNMGKTVSEQVEKITFSTNLENEKLRLEVDKLKGLLDTKDNEVSLYKQKITSGNKGFWDFMYKLFKLS